MRHETRGYATWLWWMLVLFCFRVLAQLIQSSVDLKFLPKFEAWHSGAIPYWLLLVFQILIIAVCAWTAWRFTAGKVSAKRSRGLILLCFGMVYFGAMTARLTLGLTLFPGHYWIDRPLPSFFHLVLASFVLITGHYHWKHSVPTGDD